VVTSFLLWILVFICLAFIPSGNLFPEGVSFYTFYRYLIGQIANNLVLTVILFVITSAVLILKSDFQKLPLKDRIYSGVYRNLQILLISFLSSGLAIFFIAVLELNILAVIFNFNSSSLGLVTDSRQIAGNILKNSSPPRIVASDPNGHELIKAVAAASTGQDNYYGKNVIPLIPDFLVLKIPDGNSSLAMIDANLIVRRINPDDLAAISPALAYKLVQEQFPKIPVKSTAVVSILSDEKYREFRLAEMDRKSAKIASEAAELTEATTQLTADLNTRNRLLSQSKTHLENIYNQRETAHSQCLAAGRYLNGVFQKTNSEADCLAEYNSWADRVKLAMDEISKIQLSIGADENQLAQTHTTLKFIQAQSSVLKVLENNIPNEYGSFQPEESIGIAFVPDSSHRIADYFGTLIHEYLHYASFTSEDRILSDAFFEEGLTEYFSRQIIARHFDVKSNIGYPAITKIISQLAKRIPESELAEIYFTKNQPQLEAVLGRVYGDGFYKQNRLLFISLQYATQPDQIVNYANLLMEKIGGPALNSADVGSSATDL
jgi:hypothetical protein